jgi:hypothetical protein
MHLVDIVEKFKQESKIDLGDLANQSLRTPRYRAKYMKMRVLIKRKLDSIPNDESNAKRRELMFETYMQLKSILLALDARDRAIQNAIECLKLDRVATQTDDGPEVSVQKTGNNEKGGPAQN